MKQNYLLFCIYSRYVVCTHCKWVRNVRGLDSNKTEHTVEKEVVSLQCTEMQARLSCLTWQHNRSEMCMLRWLENVS